ncbi:Mn-containing catalase-like protein, partial [Pedosphaera parvula Ellin514]
AKIVYERLINFCDDAGSKDALQFLMTREITHLKAFTTALNSLTKDPFTIGNIPPTPNVVNQYYNDSTGEGDYGEIDARGPWNEGPGIRYVEAPAKMEAQVTQEQVSREIKRATGRAPEPAAPRSKRFRR